MNGVQREIGPAMPSRGAVYALAREARALAALAAELSLAGPGCDLARAVRTLDRLRAVLGPGTTDNQEQEQA